MPIHNYGEVTQYLNDFFHYGLENMKDLVGLTDLTIMDHFLWGNLGGKLFEEIDLSVERIREKLVE